MSGAARETRCANYVPFYFRKNALTGESGHRITVSNVRHEQALTPKELRVRAGLTLIQAAVLACKAEATIRIYEGNREGVSKRSRTDLDAFYARLAATSQAPSQP